MFWVKDKHGFTGKVYETRVVEDCNGEADTLFLIHLREGWVWVDADEYSPL